MIIRVINRIRVTNLIRVIRELIRVIILAVVRVLIKAYLLILKVNEVMIRGLIKQ